MSSARKDRVPTGHFNYFKDEQFSVVAAVEVLCDQECCFLSSSPDMTSLVTKSAHCLHVTGRIWRPSRRNCVRWRTCGRSTKPQTTRPPATTLGPLMMKMMRRWIRTSETSRRPAQRTHEEEGRLVQYLFNQQKFHWTSKTTLSSGNTTHFPSSMIEMCVTLENAGFVFNL